MEPVPGRRGPRGRPAADVAAIGGDHAYETTQRLIGEELRKARKAKGWSQTQLAEAIGASRFMVIRLEAGTSDLRKEIAERIEAALECSGLVDLIDRRDQLVDSDGWSDRDSVMRRLLRTPRLQTVRIVLADDLDLYELLVDNPAVGDARIEVIVPTMARERQLFHALPIYGHLEQQITHLSWLVDVRSSSRIGEIQVLESPKVLSPAVIIRSPAGTECAYWPVAPVGSQIDGRDMQVVSTSDAQVTVRVDAHIDAVKAAASPIRKTQVVALVHPEPRPRGEDRPLEFTRFEAGSDPEELGDDEAFAVALLLIHTVCPRRDLGIKRRLLVYKRPEYADRWSLPGQSVQEIDVRQARHATEGHDFTDLRRSSTDRLAASLEHAAYFEQFGGTIPLQVFKEAARRGLFTDYGIDISIGRLHNVVLPRSLQRIAKDVDRDEDRSAVVRRIAPRLFTLELMQLPGSSVHELSIIKENVDVEEWGYEDIAEQDDGDLNDFLKSAESTGFLLKMCQELGVAAR